MKKPRISLWEKVKRVIAHAFELKTRREIQEEIERTKFEEEQAQLRLQHHQHIRSLMIEYADEIEDFKRQREEERLAEEKERQRKEVIDLYKDNRRKQSAVYYREVEETMEEVSTSKEVTEE
jgi:hypothetical protein